MLFRLLQLEKVDTTNDKIYFNLAMLSMDDQNFLEAKKWFDKAINVGSDIFFVNLLLRNQDLLQLKPDFRSAIFNVALLLCNDLQRPLDALPYLQALLHVSVVF
jgi:hypothetical protein